MDTRTIAPPRHTIANAPNETSSPAPGVRGQVRAAQRALEAALGQPLALVDAASGEVTAASSSELPCHWAKYVDLVRETVRRGAPEIIEEEAPLAMIAVPLNAVAEGRSLAVVGVFLTMQAESIEEVASAAHVFGVDPDAVLRWSRSQSACSPDALVRLAAATVENVAHRAAVSQLQFELNDAVAHARDTYVELGLLHRLARTVDVSQDPGEVMHRAVRWLADAMPAECLAVVVENGQEPSSEQGEMQLLCEVIQGDCPLSAEELAKMVAGLGDAARRPMVLNRANTSAPSWRYPGVRELACAPILQGSRIDGWLLAINHAGRGSEALREFGSAEVRLLESVGTILGVHRSNSALVTRLGEIFSASVQALITAIDAKDPYTHGHSERVARVAVCLAEELGLSRREIDTLYLGGLLHDIGKIGIDDAVLKKPGQLSAEEFEQVKQHPQRGFEILQSVRELKKILPIVLHHHEAWDGQGYPRQFAGDETPLLARVTAVADAYDAMSSDRPYRRGMADEKLDSVFREGAGRQWDPKVVDAFFACREKIRQVARDETVGKVALDPRLWVC